MPVNVYRNKLLQAILYFAKNTKNLNTTKLAKLLYFLDFQHFQQTGYPCIGLEYYAFKNGPLPREFWAEVKDGEVPEDFKGKLSLSRRADELNPTFKEITFSARNRNPDLSCVYSVKQTIMQDLAFIYKEAKAVDISEVSHLPKQPWDITFKTKGDKCLIDYMLIFDEKAGVEREESKQSLKEHFEAVSNFHLHPAK